MRRHPSPAPALLAGALVALLPPARAAAQCGPRSLDRPARREHLLVTPAWLAAHARDAGLVILHVGTDGFRNGHIPGARTVDPMALTAGDHDLAPLDRLQAQVEALGTGEDTSYTRPGRIPGARNIPFDTVVDSTGHVLARPELERLFTAAGATSDTLVVAYCHIGQQATAVWFAARLLGREARLYDGSYVEWNRLTELPVERTAP